MSAGRKKGVRYRRRVIRGVKKTFINLVFAPARIPKIKQDTVDLSQGRKGPWCQRIQMTAFKQFHRFFLADPFFCPGEFR